MLQGLALRLRAIALPIQPLHPLGKQRDLPLLARKPFCCLLRLYPRSAGLEQLPGVVAPQVAKPTSYNPPSLKSPTGRRSPTPPDNAA